MKKFRIISLLSVVVLSVSAFASCSAQPSAGITSPALVSKVTRYDIDYQTGDWYQKEVKEYEYDNSFPKSIKSHDFDGDVDTLETYEYTFKNDLPYVMKKYNEDGHVMTSSYNKRGSRNRDHYYFSGGSTELVYQYGNRDQYFTMVHHETMNSDINDPDVPDDHAEEVDSIIITSKDGLLVRTVNDGIYANWSEGDEKQWCRFFGSYTAEYDTNGIVCKTSAIFNTIGGSGDQDKYELKIEDGRVTEAVRYVRNTSDQANEDEWEQYTKYEFDYTDTAISADRYASMINFFLMEGGGTYYIYNWF